MPNSTRHLSAARDLQALAHPVRVAIVEQLTIHGALTASQVADRIDESPSNCSWHMRKLAEHGFIERSPGATGRQRPWQVTQTSLSYDEYEEPSEPMESTQAGDALIQMMAERELDRLHVSREHLRGDSEEWQQAAGVVQSLAWLTAAELRAINETVQGLLLATLDRIEDPAKRPAGSRLCALVHWGLPTYGLADPTPESEEA